MARAAILRGGGRARHNREVFGRRAAATVELPIEREETIAIMVRLMSMDSKLDDITALLSEEDDDDGTEEADA